MKEEIIKQEIMEIVNKIDNINLLYLIFGYAKHLINK